MTSTIQNGEGVSIFDRPVDLVGGGAPEPTLRRIVYLYYRAHFSEFEATGFSDEYIASLAREPATADVERVFGPTADELEAVGKAPWQGPQPIEDHAKQWKGRQWVPLEAAIADVQFWQRRDYEHSRTSALSRPAPSSEPAIAEGERVRDRQTGQTGVVNRIQYVVQYDEPDGTQGAMGGSVGVCEYEADHIEALAQSSTPPASKAEKVGNTNHLSEEKKIRISDLLATGPFDAETVRRAAAHTEAMVIVAADPTSEPAIAGREPTAWRYTGYEGRQVLTDHRYRPETVAEHGLVETPLYNAAPLTSENGQ